MKNIMLVVTLLLSPVAYSQDATQTKRIDERQENQEQRIENGVANGSLNANEANRLEKQQNHIENMETKAAADGKLTGKERRRIEKAQDHASRQIRRQKHDRQRKK